MRNINKRIIATILCMIICVSMFSIIGYAEEETESSTETYPVLITKDDFIYYERAYKGATLTEFDVYDYMEALGENQIYYIIADSSLKTSTSAEGISYRGITIGEDSIEDTISVYGYATVYTFTEDELIYQCLSNDNSESAVLMENQTETYITYDYEDKGQIIFYFDSDEILMGIAYTNSLLDDNYYRETDTIMRVQVALNEAGYDCGTPDGIAGSNTEIAVILYQANHGLTVNGLINAEVVNLLFGLSDDTSSQEETESAEISEVETAYNTACSLTMDDLTIETSSWGSVYYYYNDLIIQTDDEEWLTSSLNKNQTLSQGALYRTIATYLEGFAATLNNGSAYGEILTGVEWTSKADFEPYATNAAEFICNENSFKQVIKKLESLSCVSGTFDYDANTYHIEIPDLTECADEMMISETMLGYIFAMMAEYAPEIVFNGNQCTIDYEPYY